MELIEGSPEVVCDVGPLIHLHEVDCLDLLSGFAAIWVPDAVLAEVEQHRPAVLAIDSPKLRRLRTDTIRNPRLLAVARAFSLHRGEMAALACLQNRPQAILLTDDAAARMAAQALGLRAHGTIGVLLRAIRYRQRERKAVLSILRSLPRISTLYIQNDLLTRIIEQVERLEV